MRCMLSKPGTIRGGLSAYRATSCGSENGFGRSIITLIAWAIAYQMS